MSAIYFGLLRVEARFLLLTILPEDAGGVKRARALVHSRAVGAKFPHQASLTVAKATDLSAPTVRSKLRLDTGSASSSVPSSPNLQLGSPTQIQPGPSPLRSTFPQTYHASSPPQLHATATHQNQEETVPPPIPAKESTNLARVGTNTSARSAQASSQPGDGAYGYVNGVQQGSLKTGTHPNIFGSASDAGRSGLGLGLPVSRSQSIDHRQHASVGTLDASRGTTEPYTRSPRLASLNASPSMRQAPDRSVTPTEQTALAAEPISPPVPPKKQSLEARDFAQKGQTLTMPAAADDTAPSSARTLEASTLASMLEPSEADTSVESVALEESTSEIRTNGNRESTLSERQAIAERLAWETEERWHCELEMKRRQEQAERAAREAAAQAERDEVDRLQREAAAKAEEERLQRAAEERVAAEEAERQRQDEEAQAERARIADAEEAEAQRIAEAEEAERARIAEEERLRQEEKERQEAEAKRLREEAEQQQRDRVAELERQKREAEEAKVKAKEDLRLRLEQGTDAPALTGFVSVQGGPSIVCCCSRCLGESKLS